MITRLSGVVGRGFPVSKDGSICGALLTSYSIGMAVLFTLIFPMGVVSGADTATEPSSQGIGLEALDCCLPCLLALHFMSLKWSRFLVEEDFFFLPGSLLRVDLVMTTDWCGILSVYIQFISFQASVRPPEDSWIKLHQVKL